MIAMATLPVLTHNDTTVQYRELGIPLERGDLHQIKIGVNLMKVSAVIPRGEKAVRVTLPGQPLRIELSMADFHDTMRLSGVPTILVPVPFSEDVAKQLVENDDLFEFFPQEQGFVPPQVEGMEQQPVPARIVNMLVNVLNVAHFGGVAEGVTNMQVIGLPNILPIAMNPEAVMIAIGEAVRGVEGIVQVKNENVMYNNFYDACPVGWGAK